MAEAATRRILVFLAIAVGLTVVLSVAVRVYVAWQGDSESGQLGLEPGYVLCESGGQLRWFIDLEDLNSLWGPHPEDWELPVMLDGGKYFGSEARKAIAQGWCHPTADMRGRVEVLENCDEHLPYPNGGCRKVRVGGNGEWYTFGDAVR